jgi:hypothetical protein
LHHSLVRMQEIACCGAKGGFLGCFLKIGRPLYQQTCLPHLAVLEADLSKARKGKDFNGYN